MKLTLTQAAKEVGVSKSTLSRAIEKGRMSAHKNDLGRFQIDPSELFRVFNPTSRNSGETEHLERDATKSEAFNITILGKEIEHLKATIAMVQEREADLKVERDNWRDQAQRLALPKPDVERVKPVGIIARILGLR